MRALVVDDNHDLRFLISRLLSICDFETAEAGDGRAAITMMETAGPFDLVVLDVQMPVTDGWHALEAIRRRPEWDDVRIVMCTVKGGAPDLARGWELGCDGYLAKPFDIADFRELIHDVMARGEADRRKVRAGEILRARAMLSERDRSRDRSRLR